PKAITTRSVGCAPRRGTSRCIATFAVAPDNPSARHATGRPVMRASARAVVAENVSSPRATPMPETAESPIARMRRHLPVPGMNPQCGGRAPGKDGIRRRVTIPCNATNGNSASDPKTPAVSLARDRGLPEPEDTSLRPASISEQSPTLIIIVIAAALRRCRNQQLYRDIRTRKDKPESLVGLQAGE